MTLLGTYFNPNPKTNYICSLPKNLTKTQKKIIISITWDDLTWLEFTSKQGCQMLPISQKSSKNSQN